MARHLLGSARRGHARAGCLVMAGRRAVWKLRGFLEPWPSGRVSLGRCRNVCWKRAPISLPAASTHQRESSAPCSEVPSTLQRKSPAPCSERIFRRVAQHPASKPPAPCSVSSEHPAAKPPALCSVSSLLCEHRRAVALRHLPDRD